MPLESGTNWCVKLEELWHVPVLVAAKVQCNLACASGKSGWSDTNIILRRGALIGPHTWHDFGRPACTRVTMGIYIKSWSVYNVDQMMAKMFCPNELMVSALWLYAAWDRSRANTLPNNGVDSTCVNEPCRVVAAAPGQRFEDLWDSSPVRNLRGTELNFKRKLNRTLRCQWRTFSLPLLICLQNITLELTFKERLR